jgi:hypothetical protein
MNFHPLFFVHTNPIMLPSTIPSTDRVKHEDYELIIAHTQKWCSRLCVTALILVFNTVSTVIAVYLALVILISNYPCCEEYVFTGKLQACNVAHFLSIEVGFVVDNNIDVSEGFEFLEFIISSVHLSLKIIFDEPLLRFLFAKLFFVFLLFTLVFIIIILLLLLLL